jgi:hypothetical protein
MKFTSQFWNPYSSQAIDLEIRWKLQQEGINNMYMHYVSVDFLLRPAKVHCSVNHISVR